MKPRILIISLFIIVAAFATAWTFVTDPEATSPSLGDWGDFIGGFAALITLIWLIDGHFENRKEINESRRDLAEQLRLTREVVGTLTRIASSSQVQAGEVLAEAKPRFQFAGSTGENLSSSTVATRPTSGRVSFKNVGGPVFLDAIESLDANIVPSLEQKGQCHSDSSFNIHIKSMGPLKNAGAIQLRLRFRDKFERHGFAEIRIRAFDATPDVVVHMGQ